MARFERSFFACSPTPFLLLCSCTNSVSSQPGDPPPPHPDPLAFLSDFILSVAESQLRPLAPYCCLSSRTTNQTTIMVPQQRRNVVVVGAFALLLLADATVNAAFAAFAPSVARHHGSLRTNHRDAAQIKVPSTPRLASADAAFRLNVKKVFIDGEAGTTGLQVRERLAKRDDLEILSIADDKRKDETERRRLINEADAVILCTSFGEVVLLLLL
jgi:hypothetical protein